MKQTTVFLFSGQDSHYFKMGKTLFDQYSVFHTWMMYLDDIVQTYSGESVLYHLYEQSTSSGQLFDRTLYTHPAIFMVEYALAQTLIKQGIVPDIVIGSSLGEFTSATVAGFLNVEQALKLVVQPALLIEAYCEPGSMLAVLSNVRLYHETPLLATCGIALEYCKPSTRIVQRRGKKQWD